MPHDIPALDFFQFDIFPNVEHSAILAQGKNERQVVLVGKGLNDAALLPFLDKILTAIQLDRERDCALVDTSLQAISFADLLHQLEPQVGILFGCLPNEISWRVQMQPYQWLHWQDTDWLLAHSLADLQGSQQAYKKNLWNCLQARFIK